MTTVNNSTPMVNLNGIRDESITQLVAEPEQTPQHLALYFIKAPYGPEGIADAIPVSSANDLMRIFGSDVVNPRAPYYNHQTELMTQTLAAGNSAFVKRIIYTGTDVNGALNVAPNKANFTLNCQVTANASLPTYARNPDNSVSYDSNGNIILTTITVGATTGVATFGTISGGAGYSDGTYTNVTLTRVSGTTPTTLPTATVIVSGGAVTTVTLTTPGVGVDTTTVLTALVGTATPTTAWSVPVATTATTAPLTVGQKYIVASLGNTTTAQWVTAGVVLASGQTTVNVGQSFTCAAETVGTGTVSPATTGSILKYTITASTASTPATTTSTVSTVNGLTVTTYPILTFTAPFSGGLGNQTGIRLWTAGNTTSLPGDRDVIIDQKALIFNGQVIFKPTNSTPQLVADLTGSTNMQFCFKPNAYNYKTNQNLNIGQFVDNWSDDGVISGNTPSYSPVGSVTLINDGTGTPYLNTVLNALLATENAAHLIAQAADTISATALTVGSKYYIASAGATDFTTIGSTDNNVGTIFVATGIASSPSSGVAGTVYPVDVGPISSGYMLDFLTGIDFNGNPHMSFQIDKTGVVMAEGVTTYLVNGTAGGVDNLGYEQAICDFITSVGANDSHPLLDMAVYPFKNVYDSGFGQFPVGQMAGYPSMATKLALFKWIGYRKDMNATVGTYIVGTPQLTVAQELSVGKVLSTSALMYGESALWGTPTCRAVITMGSGLLNNSTFNGPVPTTFDLAIKRAGYMGAGSGIMTSGQNYTINPKNNVTSMRKITNTILGQTTKITAWNEGLNYVQMMDRRTPFWADLQTVYNIQNSVLASELFMSICCDITQIAAKVWRIMSGRTNLTPGQWVDKTNELVNSLTAGRYDGLVVIVPTTYFTPADNARGYSWTLDIAVYGNVAKTVQTVNIITKRLLPTTTGL